MLTDSEILVGIHNYGEPLWRKLEEQTKAPLATQIELLNEILKRNKDTKFGKKYGFKDIKTIGEFQASVPIQTYETLEGYLNAQDREGKAYLTSDNPTMYIQTSGTTGRAKYIPILERNIEQAKRRALLFNYLHFRLKEYFFSGKILSIAGSAADSVTENNTPCGSYSGLLYKLIPEEMIHKYLLPKAFSDIEDYEAKYLLMAGLALAEKNLSLLVTANPSIFLKLLDVIQERWQDLLYFVENGDLNALSLDQSYQQFLPEDFKGNKERASELRFSINNSRQLTFAMLWPDISSIVTWTGGSCGFVIPKIKALLPSKARVVDLGYLSSEFIGTLTIDADTNAQIPLINENFYEFVDREEWLLKKEKAKILTINELKKRKQYFVIVTAQNGLYRYFINDLIEVTGSFNDTPTICFIQKGLGVTDLAGEKLYEHQLLKALEAIKVKFNLNYNFFVMLADPEKQRYSLFVECGYKDATILEKVLENELGLINAGIEVMRKEGGLNKTIIVRLEPGTTEAYKKHYIKKGQRESQFKVLTLQYAQNCDFDFAKFSYNQ